MPCILDKGEFLRTKKRNVRDRKAEALKKRESSALWLARRTLRIVLVPFSFLRLAARLPFRFKRGEVFYLKKGGEVWKWKHGRKDLNPSSSKKQFGFPCPTAWKMQQSLCSIINLFSAFSIQSSEPDCLSTNFFKFRVLWTRPCTDCVWGQNEFANFG